VPVAHWYLFHPYTYGDDMDSDTEYLADVWADDLARDFGFTITGDPNYVPRHDATPVVSGRNYWLDGRSISLSFKSDFPAYAFCGCNACRP
jgi:hypothetical protein